MAYETGTPTTIDDLMTKLATFVTGLSTTPWTQENTDLSYDWVTFSRGTCYVSFRWNSTTAVNLGVFQSLHGRQRQWLHHGRLYLWPPGQLHGRRHQHLGRPLRGLSFFRQ